MDIATASYSLTRAFPKEEVYGMTSQIRRAASSIPANIAEGHGRETTGAFINHLRIAQGSLKELETHLLLAIRVNITTLETTESLLQQSDEAGRMIRALVRSLQQKVGN